ETSPSDPATWTAGGAYLAMVVVVTTLGARLFARYMERGVELTAELSEREARLQSYFDLSLVGMAVVASPGRCLAGNAGVCRVVEAPASTVLGAPWTSAIVPDDVSVATGLVAQALAGAPARMDLRLVGANERTIHATVAVRGLPGPDGRIDHAMVLVHDI